MPQKMDTFDKEFPFTHNNADFLGGTLEPEAEVEAESAFHLKERPTFKGESMYISKESSVSVSRPF